MNFFSRALLLLCSLLPSTLLLAHHGVTAKFDPTQPQHIQGRVSRIDWAFPHVHLWLDVTAGSSTDVWYVELESPQLLELNTWSESSVRIGELLDITGPRARNGSRQVWGESVKRPNNTDALFTTTRYPNLVSSISTRTADATPRWPDGSVRLGAAPKRVGYWVPTVNTLQEDGANVAMAANGQLANLADASKVAPLQEWALSLYQARQRNFLQSDPTYLECRPPAGPRKFLNPYGIQLLEDKALQRIFVIAGGGNHDWHLLYTDGRALNSDAFGMDAGNLLYYGHNTAHWQGDALVIESNSYTERFWLPGGLPHTELLNLTETLTRVDYDTMRYEVLIDDAGTYTRPWRASWTLRWLEGQDPPEHYCQDNRL